MLFLPCLYSQPVTWDSEQQIVNISYSIWDEADSLLNGGGDDLVRRIAHVETGPAFIHISDTKELLNHGSWNETMVKPSHNI